MSIYLKNFIRFWIIVLIQVYILDKVALRWWAQPSGFPIFVPYLYPLFLLLLPFDTPVWAMLLLGFGLGITVDSFSDTAGMHACAAVLLAYLRTNVLKALLPKNLVEYPNQSPNVKNMGWVPFLVYASFLLLVHHATFFIIEIWSLQHVGILFLKIFASTVTSLLLVLVYLLLFTNEAKS